MLFQVGIGGGEGKKFLAFWVYDAAIYAHT